MREKTKHIRIVCQRRTCKSRAVRKTPRNMSSQGEIFRIFNSSFSTSIFAIQGMFCFIEKIWISVRIVFSFLLCCVWHHNQEVKLSFFGLAWSRLFPVYFHLWIHVFQTQIKEISKCCTYLSKPQQNFSISWGKQGEVAAIRIAVELVEWNLGAHCGIWLIR